MQKISIRKKIFKSFLYLFIFFSLVGLSTNISLAGQTSCEGFVDGGRSSALRGTRVCVKVYGWDEEGGGGWSTYEAGTFGKLINFQIFKKGISLAKTLISPFGFQKLTAEGKVKENCYIQSYTRYTDGSTGSCGWVKYDSEALAIHAPQVIFASNNNGHSGMVWYWYDPWPTSTPEGMWIVPKNENGKWVIPVRFNAYRTCGNEMGNARYYLSTKKTRITSNSPVSGCFRCSEPQATIRKWLKQIGAVHVGTTSPRYNGKIDLTSAFNQIYNQGQSVYYLYVWAGSGKDEILIEAPIKFPVGGGSGGEGGGGGNDNNGGNNEEGEGNEEGPGGETSINPVSPVAHPSCNISINPVQLYQGQSATLTISGQDCERISYQCYGALGGNSGSSQNCNLQINIKANGIGSGGCAATVYKGEIQGFCDSGNSVKVKPKSWWQEIIPW